MVTQSKNKDMIENQPCNIDELLDVFDRIKKVPESERLELQKIGHRKKVKKGEYLFHEGERYTYVWIIVEGLMKRIFLREDGREFIHYFAHKPMWVGSFSSILKRVPANVSTLALEDTELVGYDFDVFSATFYDRHPVWNYIIRKIAESLFISREDRERQFLLYSAQERYLRFLKDYGSIEHRIPQSDVSAYIGITPEALSRLKKKME